MGACVVKVFSLQVPTEIEAQEYQVTNTELEFSSDLFTYLPIDVDKTLVHTVTLSDLSTLPSFITYTEADG